MTLIDKPEKGIFPIIKCKTSNGENAKFLGVGFFISDNGKFMTAKHVFDDAKLMDGEKYFIFDLLAFKTHEVSNVVLSENYDLATGEASSFQNTYFFKIAEKDYPINLDILNCEFSQTKTSQLGEFTGLEFFAQHHKGNVVSTFWDNFLGGGRVKLLKLSFPAMRGASGSPVIVEKTGDVVGVVVANQQTELLPAQMERVFDSDGKVEEEIKYFLPFGVAISWEGIQAFLKEVAEKNPTTSEGK